MPIPTPVGDENPTYSLVGFLLPNDNPDMREVITGLLISLCDESFWQQSSRIGALTVAQALVICEVILNSWIGE